MSTGEEEERLLEETQLEDLPLDGEIDDETKNTFNDEDKNDTAAVSEPTENRLTKTRNIIGFWLLGFCIDYAYFIMLSAAFDIIHSLEDTTPSGWSNTTNGSGFDQCVREVNGSWPGREPCERESTSLILLADILPLFLMKLTVPFFMNFIPYWIRVLATAVFSLLSFILVGLSLNRGVVILGVVCASISTGFGELTFLSLTSRFKKYSVAALGSGTGFAGVGGTAVYALSKLFLSTSVTLYLQLYIPVVMVIVYFTVLGKPGHILPHESESESDTRQQNVEPELNLQQNVDLETDRELESIPELEEDMEPFKETESLMSHNERGKLKVKLFNKEELTYWWRHVKYVPRLWKYMLPLFVVYLAEYMINQSLYELMYNSGTHVGKICVDQRKQYRGLQVMYTIGVFLSRSSVSLFRIKYYWIMSILQVFNFVFFFFAACYLFIPSFWITCLLVLYEGLLGGAVFVNAFYSISQNVPTIHREFSMGVASVADSVGITVAAVLSEWVIHSFICRTFVDSELDMDIY